MLDIVVGDMAWAGKASTVDYSTFKPFNDQKYFHDYKLLSEDMTNDTCVLDVSLLPRVMRALLKIGQCWMGDNTISLPDLRNEDQEVQQILGTWVSQLVSNYSSVSIHSLCLFTRLMTLSVVVDGLRIDSVLNIAPVFFSNFSNSAGVFTMGEGATRDASAYCSLQPGLSGLLNYSL
jgi:alpha-amylase